MRQAEHEQEWLFSSEARPKALDSGTKRAAASQAGRLGTVPHETALPVDTDWDNPHNLSNRADVHFLRGSEEQDRNKNFSIRPIPVSTRSTVPEIVPAVTINLVMRHPPRNRVGRDRSMKLGITSGPHGRCRNDWKSLSPVRLPVSPPRHTVQCVNLPILAPWVF
jgi:hypothetical protein